MLVPGLTGQSDICSHLFFKSKHKSALYVTHPLFFQRSCHKSGPGRDTRDSTGAMCFRLGAGSSGLWDPGRAFGWSRPLFPSVLKVTPERPLGREQRDPARGQGGNEGSLRLCFFHLQIKIPRGQLLYAEGERKSGSEVAATSRRGTTSTVSLPSALSRFTPSRWLTPGGIAPPLPPQEGFIAEAGLRGPAAKQHTGPLPAEDLLHTGSTQPVLGDGARTGPPSFQLISILPLLPLSPESGCLLPTFPGSSPHLKAGSHCPHWG